MNADRKRLLVLTYNEQGGCPVGFLSKFKFAYDMVAISVQESCRSIPASFCNDSKLRFANSVLNHFTEYANYHIVFQKAINALYLLIIALPDTEITCLKWHILKLGKYGPNKGAIVCRFCSNGIPFCFISAHFEAGTSSSSQERRFAQLNTTLAKASKIRSCEHSEMPTILIAGDLNSRICASTVDVRRLALEKDYQALLKADEMSMRWKYFIQDVGPVSFRPTYKVTRLADYVADSCPSYTDRIATTVNEHGSILNCIEYRAIDYYASDHLPVFAVFSFDQNPELSDLII